MISPVFRVRYSLHNFLQRSCRISLTKYSGKDTLSLVMKRMNLKAARLAAGLTQDELAAKSGVSQSSIVKYERDPDADPSVSAVDALESALGLRRGTLIFGRQQQMRAS